MKRRAHAFPLAVLVLCAPAVVRADGPDVQVARISYTGGGGVSYQRGDVDGWNAVGMNTPLVTGDSLYTADDGRAEVYLGNGNVLRLDSGTQVDLVGNARDLAQLGLRSGYLSLRARSASEGAAVEIDTPNGAATVLDPGVYRVEMTDDTARYSVVKGRLSVALRGQQLDVDAGETLTIEGTDEPRYSFGPIAPQSSFDTWARDRDLRADRSTSARYVHRDVVGYEDLDDNGTWQETPDYGRVWMPSGVSAGWAPYQVGRWMWQDPYGWTWVSAEPWGWAPYHYGRWAYIRGSWGWVPPPPVGYHCPAVVAEIRPTYAPALVAFIGGGNWSVGVSLGGGPSIGWVPLAPAEHYDAPWQPAPRVTNNYTYTNITVVNAVTVVNTTSFARGPIRPIHVPPGQLKQAPRMGYTATGIIPTRDSLCPFHPRDPNSRYVPRREIDRPLIVRTTPPPKPVPFRDKVVEIQRTGRPFDGHDRGQHAGGNGRGDRDDRIATVSALSPGERAPLTSRQGPTAKAPKSIERAVVPSPRTERPHPIDGGAPVVRTEPSREPMEGHRSSAPSRPEQVVVSPAAPPAERAHRKTWNEEHHVAPPEQGSRAHAPAPQPAVAMTPENEPDRSHGRPAETMREPHAAASTPPVPRPAAPPVVDESHGRPQPNGGKPQAPKAKDEKARDQKGKGEKDKEKEKPEHDGQPQGR